MKTKRTIISMFVVFLLMGFSQNAWAQPSIDDVTAELVSDNDFVSIGDTVIVTVNLNDATDDTEVQLLGNIFVDPSSVIFTRDSGNVFTGEAVIGDGSTPGVAGFDGVSSDGVTFTIRVLENNVLEESADYSFEDVGIDEDIDNVPPVFNTAQLGADDFAATIDGFNYLYIDSEFTFTVEATDGSGNDEIQVTAVSLPLVDTTAVVYDVDDDNFSFSGSVNVATDNDNLMYNAFAEFEITLTDAAGNTTQATYNSNIHSVRINNLNVPEPTAVVIPRGSTEDEFHVDVVVTQGESPRQTNGDLFNANGVNLTYDAIINGYRLTYIAGDDTLSVPTPNNEHLYALSFDKDDVSAGDEIEVEVRARQALNFITGEAFSSTATLMDTVDELLVTAPEPDFTIGNTPLTRFVVEGENSTDWQLTGAWLRYRNVPDEGVIQPAVQEPLSVSGNTFVLQDGLSANTIATNLGGLDQDEFDFFVWPRFTVNGVQLSENFERSANNYLQTQSIDNSWDISPEVVVLPRGRLGADGDYVVDVVITDGATPLDIDGQPFGASFGDIVNSYDVVVTRNDVDVHSQTIAYNSDGNFHRIIIDGDAYLDGYEFDFRVLARDASGVPAQPVTGSFEITNQVQEFAFLSPDEGYIVGNTPSTRLQLMVQNETDFSVASRYLVYRDANDTGLGNTFGIEPNTQTGSEITFEARSAEDFAGVAEDREIYAILIYEVNGVELIDPTGLLNDATLSVNNNGFLQTFIDDVDPTVELLRVNDQPRTGSPSQFNVDASGETTFLYRVVDNFPMDPNAATGTVRLFDGNGSTLLTVGPNTVQHHIDNGILEVDGDEYTLTVDLTALTPTAIAVSDEMQITFEVNDGRGNSTTSDQTASTFTIFDDTEPSFVITEPVANTQFRDVLDYRAVATNPGSTSANYSGYIVQFSTDIDFSSPFNVETNTSSGSDNIGGTIDFNNLPVNFIELEDGETYYVRIVVQGSEAITAPVPVVYNDSGPMVDLEFTTAVVVNGQERIRGEETVLVSSDEQIETLSVRARNSSNTYSGAGISVAADNNSFTLNTNIPSLAQDSERPLIIEVISTDIVGNETTQYFSVFADNKGPDFTITSINGSSNLTNAHTMISGDDLVLELDIISDDFSGEIDLRLIYTVDGEVVTLVGETSIDNSSVTVTFSTPSTTGNATVDLNYPSDLSGEIYDLVGNDEGNYVGPTIGDLNILGDEEPVVLFTNLEEGFILNNTADGITYSSSGQLVGDVLLEIRRSGQTSWIEADTDNPNASPNELTLTTTDFSDGTYDIRLVAQNVDNQYPSESIQIIIDNTNDGDSERANIVDFAGARLGGEQIELRAEAGDNVGAVEFRARRTDGAGAFIAIGETRDRSSDGTFILRVSPQDLVDAGYAGSISALDGEHELKAVGSDKAGHEFAKAKGDTPDFSTGNPDNPNEVARTFVNFDFTAPTGVVVFNESGVNSDDWNTQNANNFNMFSGNVTVSGELITGSEDFDNMRVTLVRQRSVAPGSGTQNFPNRDEVTIAVLDDASNLNYSLNTDELFRGGLYRLRVYLADDLGNESEATDVYFAVGAPKVHIAGYNPVKQQLYLVAPAYAQSAKVEVSSGGGFTNLGIHDLSGTIGGAPYDQVRTVVISLGELSLPDGDITFRVTGSERLSSDYTESRFASAPSNLIVNNTSGQMASLGVNNNLPVTFLENEWIPESGGGLAISINKDAGTLDEIRVEVQPQSSDDDVTLFLVRDNNPNNAELGDVNTTFYRTNVVTPAQAGYAEQILQNLDGQHLGFEDYSINLTAAALNISNGGVFHVFATSVGSDGQTHMAVETIRVHRVAANRGGEIRSLSGDMSMVIEPNTLNGNAGIYIQEDRARFRSELASQLDMGQVGPAHWISSPSGGTLRDGLRYSLTMEYDPNELGDIPAEHLNVAFIQANPPEFVFNTGVRDKQVDTDNNTISFTSGRLDNNRYTLVANGVESSHPGSIELVSFRVGDEGANNYVSGTPQVRVVVRDNVSGLDNTSALMYINGTRINTTSNLVSGDTNSMIFRSAPGSVNDLELDSGLHSVRFIVENNSGDRLNVEDSFVIDNDAPFGQSSTSIIGMGGNISFKLIDPAVQDTLGAGVDQSTVKVDVWADDAHFRRFNSSDLEFNGSPDSLEVSFSIPATLEQADRLKFVVHNDVNVPGTINQYVNGPSDIAGNVMNPYIFEAGYDVTPPEITVTNRTIEGGIQFSVTDDKSGVDLNSIEITQLLAGTSEVQTFTWTGNASAFEYNDANNRVTFKEAKIAADITITVSDNVGNTATEDLIAESKTLTVSEFFSFPNPYNTNTQQGQINFGLSKEAVVTIELYDFIGRKVNRILSEEHVGAGAHQIQFAGEASNGDQLANGVYFMRLTARDGDRTESVVFKTVIARN